MSKWVQYKTEVLKDVEKGLMRKSLKDMGLSYDKKGTIVSYEGETKVDMPLKKDGKRISLGINFVKNKGKLDAEITGDFWGTGLNQRDFTNLLSQHYQKNRIIKNLQNSGISVDNVVSNKKKEIVISASMIS